MERPDVRFDQLYNVTNVVSDTEDDEYLPEQWASESNGLSPGNLRLQNLLRI